MPSDLIDLLLIYRGLWEPSLPVSFHYTRVEFLVAGEFRLHSGVVELDHGDWLGLVLSIAIELGSGSTSHQIASTTGSHEGTLSILHWRQHRLPRPRSRLQLVQPILTIFGSLLIQITKWPDLATSRFFTSNRLTWLHVITISNICSRWMARSGCHESTASLLLPLYSVAI